MNFTQIFAAYHTLYRAEAVVPTSTDDEYTIAIQFANNAIARWENYDATYWKELFTTAQTNSTGGVVTITSGVSSYACPTAMREAGGKIQLKDSSGKIVQEYPIIEPQEAQFRSSTDTYAHFIGNPTAGYTLKLNPVPSTSLSGRLIDYVYYQKATRFVLGALETTEMANPYFIVHHMLYPRLRASRNPYLNTALRDAEEALKNMQQDNNSGTFANPWKVADTSSLEWGI